MDEKDTNVSEEVPAVLPEAQDKKFCTNCGAELAEEFDFCPRCGQKSGTKSSETDSCAESKTDDHHAEPVKDPVKKPSFISGLTEFIKEKKVLSGVIAAGVIIALVLGISMAVRGEQVKSISLNTGTLSIEVGGSSRLSYTIEPETIKEAGVTWSSSNKKVAKVVRGLVTGVGEGECTITAKTGNGKTAECDVTVGPAAPDLAALYNKYCGIVMGASVASDGSYLSIDTNAYDLDDFVDTSAMSAIQDINKELNIPESVMNRMQHTRALDGTQSYSTDHLEVTWSYHPNKGLFVNYAVR